MKALYTSIVLFNTMSKKMQPSRVQTILNLMLILVILCILSNNSNQILENEANIAS